jgi:hypothetical protein
VVFWFGDKQGVYGGQGNQPEEYLTKSYGGLNIRHIVYILSFLFVPVFAFLVRQNQIKIIGETGLLAFLLQALLVLVLVYIGYVCFSSSRRVVR